MSPATPKPVNPYRTRRVATLLTAALVFSAAPPAHAINIVMNFDSGASASPSFDTDGSLLTSLFDYVEDHYQAVFEDSGHTLTIDFSYANLSGTTLGVHNYGLPELFHVPPREASGTIQIDTNPTNGWFIDTTPANDSEFTMGQTLWRDLTATQQNDWYNPNTTSRLQTFEVGYTGTATAAGGASGLTDMLSVIFHEVGHALGMSSSNPLTIAETGNGTISGDGDYDFNPDFVAGESFGVETANNSGDDNLNIPHLENPNALMTPSVSVSTRSRPSHTDYFAMASINGYSQVDVPRREFYQNSNWQNPGNWSGGRLPDQFDDVFIRDAQGSGVTLTAQLNANAVADDLFVSEGANFDTNAFKLDVRDDVFVSDTNSDIFINPGGELEADHVFIQNNAEIEMDGGTIDTRRITIEPTAQLEGRTNFILVDVSQRLTVSGALIANNGADMLFVSAATDPWNLDGSGDNDGNGVVNANNGDMTFASGVFTDTFDGTMHIGAGHFITFSEPWTTRGLIDLNGGVSTLSPARLSGPAATVTMTSGEISATGTSYIEAPFTMTGGQVTLGAADRLDFDAATNISDGNFTIGAGSFIRFDGPTTLSGTPVFNFAGPTMSDGFVNLNATTTYDGGTITFNGVAQQNGAATVSGATIINADVFNLDGTTDPTWTINSPLTINADAIDIGGGFFPNSIDSTVNINNAGIILFATGGSLNVNLPTDGLWILNGTTNLDGSVPGTSPFFTNVPIMISGSLVGITGTLNMQDRGSITARVSILGTVNTADAGSLINLNGGNLTDTNLLAGGSINGPGTLGSSTGHALVGQGTINTAIDFNGTSELRADTSTLTINGAILDVGTLGTADTDGILNVTSSWNTSVTDLVELKGGSIIGSTITNAAGQTITGFGTLSPAQIANNGTIAANGGELILNYTSNPDLDGGSGDGIIQAIDGNLTIVDPVTDVYNGTATVGAGRIMNFQGGWTLSSGGILNLLGGPDTSTRARITGGTMTNTTGVIHASGIAHIDPTFNMGSGIVNVAADSELEFNGTTTISGGTFNVDTGAIFDFDGPLTLSGSPIFNTPSGDVADGQVRFDGSNTTYDGPTLTVNGLARQSGNATVSANTTINATVFDIDGNFGTPSTWTIDRNLTINADNVEIAGSNTVDSTLNINNPGNLTVNLPGTDSWTLAGTANLTGSTPPAALPDMISGSPVNITGTVNIQDQTTIAAKINLSGAINTADAGSSVYLRGGNTTNPNTIIGGTVAGPGSLETTTGKALHGHGTISANIEFTGSNILADNGTLNITGTILDVGTLGTADSDGTLNVSNPWSTSVTDLVELNGGSITGANITHAHGKLITGHGTLAINQVNNNGTLAADGGTLTIDTTLNPDLDGSSGAGVINALTGHLTVVKAVTDAFDGTANIGARKTMTFKQGWTLSPGGNLFMDGDTSSGTAAILAVADPATQAINGTVSIIDFATFAAHSTIGSTANISVGTSSTLSLEGDTHVTSGASITGSGRLLNNPEHTLTLATHATIGVHTVNNGIIEIGASPGIAAITESLSLGPKSTVHIEVLLPSPINPSPTPGIDYDQLNVTRGLTFDGILDIDPTHDADPKLGTNYPILTYAASRGMFDTINGSLIHTGLALAPLFNPNDLTLRASIPGDTNFDNAVSIADLSTFALNFGTTPGLGNWALGDFNTDGKITVADLSLLALNFGFSLALDGTTTPAAGLSLEAIASIAGIDLATVPEPATALTLLVAPLLIHTRRQRRAPKRPRNRGEISTHASPDRLPKAHASPRS